MPFEGSQAMAAHHLAVVVLPAGMARDAVREALKAKGIQTSVHYPPTHRFSLYAGSRPRSLPRTEDIAERLITLPLFPHMADDQVDLVATHLLRELQVRGRRRSRGRQAGTRAKPAEAAGAQAASNEMASNRQKPTQLTSFPILRGGIDSVGRHSPDGPVELSRGELDDRRLGDN